MVTCVEHLPVFPDPSVAVNVTVLTPIPYSLGASLTTDSDSPELSVATASCKATVATASPGDVLCSTSVGQVKDGASLSMSKCSAHKIKYQQRLPKEDG